MQVSVVERLCEDRELQDDLRLLGGVPLLLTLLRLAHTHTLSISLSHTHTLSLSHIHTLSLSSFQ